jgi:hypothetical protein
MLNIPLHLTDELSLLLAEGREMKDLSRYTTPAKFICRGRSIQGLIGRKREGSFYEKCLPQESLRNSM